MGATRFRSRKGQRRRRSPERGSAHPICFVLPRPRRPQQGVLVLGPLRLPCALGRSGVTRMKREGDGATPAGRYRLVHLIVRRDRLAGPASPVPSRAMRPTDAWEEDPRSGRYNRLVHRRAASAGDRLWRDDGLYDILGVLDWNLRPRASGRGSAIFLHVTRRSLAPTAGCIALSLPHLKRLLAACGRRPVLAVAAHPRKVR